MRGLSTISVALVAAGALGLLACCAPPAPRCGLPEIALLGAAGAGLSLLARALPWPPRWLEAKPQACAACMGGHGAWAAMLLGWEWPANGVLAWLGAAALAATIHRWVFPPDWGPPPPPP